jgi:hypothetical protein
MTKDYFVPAGKLFLISGKIKNRRQINQGFRCYWAFAPDVHATAGDVEYLTMRPSVAGPKINRQRDQ